MIDKTRQRLLRLIQEELKGLDQDEIAEVIWRALKKDAEVAVLSTPELSRVYAAANDVKRNGVM